MLSRSFPTLVAFSLVLVACQSDSAPNSAGTIDFVPPNQTFAEGLGITGGPISSEQAKEIAAAAAGGTAVAVEREDEDGVQVFGVEVQTSTGIKDVKVRISDGAVMKIESDDDAQGDDNAQGEDDDDQGEDTDTD